MLNLPMDGFTLDPNIRYYPCQFQAQALDQMNLLRRANLYRPRWFVIPDDFNTPLPAYGTLEYQIKVGPASYLWGYRFIQTSDPDQGRGEEVAPVGVYIQITDSCTGISLFSEFVGAASAAFLDVNTPEAFRMSHIPYLLTQPRLILEPGLVNVELSSTNAEDTYCQLLVLFAEPCMTVDEAAQSQGQGRRI